MAQSAVPSALEETMAEPDAPPIEETAEPITETPVPAPKRKGRPPGSKNKPKPAEMPSTEASAHICSAPPALANAVPPESKRKTKAAPRHVEPTEAEVICSAPPALTPPPTPRTAKRQAWQAYSQRRADEHRARVDAWSTRLDRLLAY